MQIYPAIDLRQGKCVRLHQGKFAEETCYSEDPLAMARNFIAEGASWLHIVDLDAAKDPKKSQINLVAELIKKTNLKIQTGGGVREEEQIKKLLDLGAERVVIGSLAISKPELVKEWLQKFGVAKLVVAMDVQKINDAFYVATAGWQEISNNKLFDLLKFYTQINLQHLLCTDISRDGTMIGPNMILYQDLLQQFPMLQLQASGGIGCLEDIQALRQIPVAGAIVGKALYENKFNLGDAL